MVTLEQFSYLLMKDLTSENYYAHIEAWKWVLEDNRLEKIIELNKDLDWNEFLKTI